MGSSGQPADVGAGTPHPALRATLSRRGRGFADGIHRKPLAGRIAPSGWSVSRTRSAGARRRSRCFASLRRFSPGAQCPSRGQGRASSSGTVARASASAASAVSKTPDLRSIAQLGSTTSA